MAQGSASTPASATNSGNGGVAVVENNGTINIGMTAEQSQKMLGENNRKLEKKLKKMFEEQKSAIAKELHNADPKDKQHIRQLEAENKDLEHKLANFESAFKEYQATVVELSKELESLRGSVSDEKLDQAQQAIARGDTQAADQLLAEFADNIKSRRAAEDGKLALANYQRGQLAKLRIDYERAFSHYAEAVAMQPDNPNYLRDAGQMAHILGRYKQARIWLERAVVLFAQQMPDSLNWAVAANNLGVLYKDSADYAKVEPLYLRALDIYEKTLGTDNSYVATELNNLSSLYKAQGQYSKAEPLGKRALYISEKVFGVDHPQVATTLNNLAQLYQAQGQYAKAEPLYQRSVQINEKALGRDHPNVAVALNNLAELYQAQGQYAKAEPLYLRTLQINEKVLGRDHPNVAVSLDNLAGLDRVQGQYAKAEPLYLRALDIQEKALGKDHPQVAAFLNNLAELYRMQGQYTKSEPLYQGAIKIAEVNLGTDHPDTKSMRKNYESMKKEMLAR